MAEHRRPVNRVQQAAAERQALAKELSERYLAGENIRAIASSIGRANSYVRRVLLEAGVQLRPHGGDRRQPIPAAERQALAGELGKRYTAGESIFALAWSVGRSERFVGALLDEAGVQRRSHTGLTPKQVRQIRVRYAAGETQIALARDYGVDASTINRIVRRNRRALG